MRRIAHAGTVLDVGGGAHFGKWLAPYAPLFAGTDYRTFDYDPATGADVVGDIHAIPLRDASVDAVICSSVLEHVRDPRSALGEIRRILAPGGLLFLYVPSIYPYHARRGRYPDYWRFFDDALRDLLAEFSSVAIEKRGGYFTALSFFIPLQHRLRFVLDPAARALDALFRTKRRTTTAGYYALAEK